MSDVPRQHPPSRSVIDDEGLKWRSCAGAAVFNSKNEILIGERMGKPGSWQTPQGGVDDGGETTTEAAIRELYEEVGLEDGKHVRLEKMDGEISPITCQYKTEGTGSWLEKEGFAGQELSWTIFRCSDSNLERDPSLVCNLSGLNGEKPEFTAVKWEKLDWVVDNVWEKKARPYQVLREACVPIMKRWEERCADLDLSGRWSRDSDRGVGVAEGLVARGLTKDTALAKATEPYIQHWKRHVTECEWVVTTYDADGIKPRRELHYPIGDFVETYEGTATLFGDGGVIHRSCFYLAEKDADDEVSHVTISETPRGREESSRYLKNGELFLRRSFLGPGKTDQVVSTEVFIRS
eukprot:CAMPEP_0196157414 /NCGR_PEP_ID=MMETSP0910-20130528/43988_1 /TAXON_ID=49265 /ORGANISM="Thalassiosira rotula, Strain GSO102" /LENGTH=349 /DNA_ID=CAMNT_0041422085 /DNA_START=122 /DNA_END=1171 /DNA_ORIENTATION=-